MKRFVLFVWKFLGREDRGSCVLITQARGWGRAVGQKWLLNVVVGNTAAVTLRTGSSNPKEVDRAFLKAAEGGSAPVSHRSTLQILEHQGAVQKTGRGQFLAQVK